MGTDSYSKATIVQRRYGALRIFFGASAGKQLAVLCCLIAAGLAEGIGIASMLPALSVAAGDTLGDSTVHRVVAQMLAALGLPLDLGVLLIVVVSAVLVKAALILLAMNYVGYVVSEIATGLRLSLMDRLLEVRWSYFTRQPVGRFANAVSSEAARAAEAFLSASLLMASIVQTTVYLLVALLISWKLSLLAAAIGSVMVLGLNRLVAISRRAGRQQTRRTQVLVSRLTDMLVGIKPLKAMAKHVRLGALFAADARELNKALRRQVFSKYSVRALQEPVLAVFLCAALYVATTVWHLPVAQVIIMGLVLAKTVTTIGKVQLYYQSVVVAESAYWTMRDTLDEAESQREAITGTAVPSLRVGCEFDRVSLAFGDKPVLADLSLSIPAGKVTAITGSSGAGKTTIADLILGLYEPSSGEIRLDGCPLRSLDLARWRGMVGYVPQEVVLFHDSIFANVTLEDPSLTRAAARAALEAAGAWDFVSQLPEEMESVVGERGTLLSGGQRQRIAVARALIHRPTLLILDEATSALDPETEAAICRNLRALAARTGLTLLAISHQPAWVAAADKVYQLHDLQVVEVPRAPVRYLAQ